MDDAALVQLGSPRVCRAHVPPPLPCWEDGVIVFIVIHDVIKTALSLSHAVLELVGFDHLPLSKSELLRCLGGLRDCLGRDASGHKAVEEGTQRL